MCGHRLLGGQIVALRQNVSVKRMSSTRNYQLLNNWLDFLVLFVFCLCYSDVAQVIAAVYNDDPPPIFLIGHRQTQQQQHVYCTVCDVNLLTNLRSYMQQIRSVANCVCLLFSMGGAVAVHVAAKQLVTSLIGLAVIDVVEGQSICVHLSCCSTLRSAIIYLAVIFAFR